MCQNIGGKMQISLYLFTWNITLIFLSLFRSEIDPKEKEVLRQPMLQIIINDQNKMLSEQLTVAEAKLTKQEFPEIWSELFPRLNQILQQGNEVQRQRALCLIHEIIKELVAIKIPYTVKLFVEVCSHYCHFLQLLIEHF